MPHVDRKLIDRFVLDMRGWKKSVGEKDQR
jgi:hypothetical protein